MGVLGGRGRGEGGACSVSQFMDALDLPFVCRTLITRSMLLDVYLGPCRLCVKRIPHSRRRNVQIANRNYFDKKARVSTECP